MRIGAPIRASDIHPSSIHLRGLPLKLGGKEIQTPMAWAACVVIVPKPDGIFLIRFTTEGEEVGDTWHRSVEDAQEQARAEFGIMLGEWREVPDDLQDDAIALHLRTAPP